MPSVVKVVTQLNPIGYLIMWCESELLQVLLLVFAFVLLKDAQAVDLKRRIGLDNYSQLSTQLWLENNA